MLSHTDAVNLNPLFVMLHRSKVYADYRKVRLNEKLIHKGLQTPSRPPQPVPGVRSYSVPAQPQFTTPSLSPPAAPQFLATPVQSIQESPTTRASFYGFADIATAEVRCNQPLLHATLQSYHTAAPSPNHSARVQPTVIPDPGTPSRRAFSGRVRRSLVIGNEVLSYCTGDIKPPTKKMKYGNYISKLVHDWEHGDLGLLQYHGVAIPMRLWPDILRKPFPDYWRTNTKQFSEFKVSNP